MWKIKGTQMLRIRRIWQRPMWRGLLRPLRGSAFGLGQPDAFGAGAFQRRVTRLRHNRSLPCCVLAEALGAYRTMWANKDSSCRKALHGNFDRFELWRRPRSGRRSHAESVEIPRATHVACVQSSHIASVPRAVERDFEDIFRFRCQKSAADAILHVSAGVPPEKTRRIRQ